MGEREEEGKQPSPHHNHLTVSMTTASVVSSILMMSAVGVWHMAPSAGNIHGRYYMWLDEPLCVCVCVCVCVCACFHVVMVIKLDPNKSWHFP